MTRWARHKNRKAVEYGSKWEEIKKTSIGSSGKIVGRRADKNSSYEGSKNSLTQLEAVKKIALKKNKRSDNRRLKRQRRKENNKVCFHCRMPGHGMADCPILKQDNEQGTGICFKCGSTEHKSHTCTVKLKPGNEFMFAKCFICGEEGHLSKTCPDNPRGLYPNGGCCKLCGSVDHYKRDCPERPVKGEVTVYRLKCDATCSCPESSNHHISMDEEIGLYEDVHNEKQHQTATDKPKVIKF